MPPKKAAVMNVKITGLPVHFELPDDQHKCAAIAQELNEARHPFLVAIREAAQKVCAEAQAERKAAQEAMSEAERRAHRLAGN